MEQDATKETIKEVMNDSSKVSEAIARIKKDRRIVSQSIDLVKNNSQLERNMTNMAREMGTGGVMGQETPLKERKKMKHQQELIRSQMKMNLAEDDIKCVVVCPRGKGNPSPMIVNFAKIEAETKWCVGTAIIGELNFITICDSSASLSNKNLNKRATAIMGENVYGLVSFVLLGGDLEPIDSNAKDFPSR